MDLPADHFPNLNAGSPTMPTLDDNKIKWNEYDWESAGHEWSIAWGGVSDQWTTTILRRIFPLLPTERILEIGPGFGRWIPYLLAHCRSYVGIDISERAVSYCRRTFPAGSLSRRFLVGDGSTFLGVANASVSFVFSFDSLVHVELDCIASYTREIARVLVPGGHAFIHHSNLAEYVSDGKLSVENAGWRATTVSAERVRDGFASAGLHSIVHEKIPWISPDHYSDCFSLVRKSTSSKEHSAPGEGAIIVNSDFQREMQISRFVSENYTNRLRG